MIRSSATQRRDSEPDEIPRSQPSDQPEQERNRFEECAKPRDAQNNKGCVEKCGHQRDGEHESARESLTKDESVLGADCDDEGEPQQQTGDKCGCHGSVARGELFRNQECKF